MPKGNLNFCSWLTCSIQLFRASSRTAVRLGAGGSKRSTDSSNVSGQWSEGPYISLLISHVLTFSTNRCKLACWEYCFDIHKRKRWLYGPHWVLHDLVANLCHWICSWIDMTSTSNVFLRGVIWETAVKKTPHPFMRWIAYCLHMSTNLGSSGSACFSLVPVFRMLENASVSSFVKPAVLFQFGLGFDKSMCA